MEKIIINSYYTSNKDVNDILQSNDKVIFLNALFLEEAKFNTPIDINNVQSVGQGSVTIPFRTLTKQDKKTCIDVFGKSRYKAWRKEKMTFISRYALICMKDGTIVYTKPDEQRKVIDLMEYNDAAARYAKKDVKLTAEYGILSCGTPDIESIKTNKSKKKGGK